LIGDVGDQAWQGEDQMEVADRKQLGFTIGKPFPCGCTLALRTMPIATAVERDHRMIAILASPDMASECCGSTTLDRTHHLELTKTHMPGVGKTPGIAMIAENIRDLQLWTGHRCGGLRRL